MRSSDLVPNVLADPYILEPREGLEDFLPRTPTREEVFNCQKSPSHRWVSSNKSYLADASYMLYA